MNTFVSRGCLVAGVVSLLGGLVWWIPYTVGREYFPLYLSPNQIVTGLVNATANTFLGFVALGLALWLSTSRAK